MSRLADIRNYNPACDDDPDQRDLDEKERTGMNERTMNDDQTATGEMHMANDPSVNGGMDNNECNHEPLLLETLPVYPITVNVGDTLRYRVTRYGCSILRGREGVCRIRELSPTMKQEWVAHIDEKQEDGTFKPSLCRFWEHGIEFAYLDGGDFHPFYWRAIPEQVRKELAAKVKPEHDRIRAARRRYGLR